jgi:hypothetical protein
LFKKRIRRKKIKEKNKKKRYLLSERF